VFQAADKRLKNFRVHPTQYLLLGDSSLDA
jgi:hypothetical protein